VQTLSPIPSRSAVIRAHKERGGRVAAVTPIHYPRALLRAFDILPVEVWGPPKVDTSHGAAHLQPYVCSIVRNVLSFLQTGGLDVTDLILVPHTCDSLQGLGSLLIDFIHPKQPVIPLYLPRARRASDIGFLTDEFRSLYRRLEAITHCSPSNADLMESIRREENADKLLALLHQRRRQLALTDLQLYRLIRSREYLPVELFSELAQAALAHILPPSPDTRPARRPAIGKEEPRKRIPIILSGIVPEPMDLFESLSEMGGAIVADDLACCGRRLYPPGRSNDPFQHLAESILGAPPDSTRGHPIQERLDHLIRLARTSEAKGIVFYDVKFCEPELFDLPILRKGLQEAGIPSATVEVDISDPLSHQTVTRLEAFLEMMA
jgi:benzoyl-CoA reductase/2-hydroxyglutaryl-CoA dehydratase subunit BcrC/BadD/HgdB